MRDETAAAADAWSTALLVAGTPGMSMGSDELLARVVVLDSGEILSSVIPPRAGSAGLGTEAGCSWCTLEVGA